MRSVDDISAGTWQNWDGNLRSISLKLKYSTRIERNYGGMGGTRELKFIVKIVFNIFFNKSLTNVWARKELTRQLDDLLREKRMEEVHWPHHLRNLR